MEFLKQYEILVKKSKTDLKVAKNILEDFNNGDEDLDLEVIMFHLQQSAEKLLKALLSFNKYHITKTHDINHLIKNIKNNNIAIIDNIETLSLLSDYAVEGRYAIINDDLEDVDKYIEILNELQEFVKKVITK